MTSPVTAAEPTVEADRRREIGAVLGLMVLAGGGALFACSRVWLTLAVNRPAPFAALSVTVPGRTEFPALAGLAVVTLLAGIVALIAGRWAGTPGVASQSRATADCANSWGVSARPEPPP
jgi:hypothetical protein